ncbi:hypothetical protein HanRHA438_Chr14g0656311 [Helianthus annuus]|nr:hypothetical protein HanRHA438_Chr14g0656311 [Helianthus annuus]
MYMINYYLVENIINILHMNNIINIEQCKELIISSCCSTRVSPAAPLGRYSVHLLHDISTYGKKTVGDRT